MVKSQTNVKCLSAPLAAQTRRWEHTWWFESNVRFWICEPVQRGPVLPVVLQLRPVCVSCYHKTAGGWDLGSALGWARRWAGRAEERTVMLRCVHVPVCLCTWFLVRASRKTLYPQKATPFCFQTLLPCFLLSFSASSSVSCFNLFEVKLAGIFVVCSFTICYRVNNLG